MKQHNNSNSFRHRCYTIVSENTSDVNETASTGATSNTLKSTKQTRATTGDTTTVTLYHLSTIVDNGSKTIYRSELVLTYSCCGSWESVLIVGREGDRCEHKEDRSVVSIDPVHYRRRSRRGAAGEAVTRRLSVLGHT